MVAWRDLGNQDRLTIKGWVQGRRIARGPEEPVRSTQRLDHPDLPRGFHGPLLQLISANARGQGANAIICSDLHSSGGNLARLECAEDFSEAGGRDTETVAMLGPNNPELPNPKPFIEPL